MKRREALFRFIQRTSNRFDARFTASGKILLLAIVVSFIFALDPRQTLAYQLTAVLLAIFTVALIGVLLPRISLDIQRRLPQFLVVGVPSEYAVELTNAKNADCSSLSIRDYLASEKTLGFNYRADGAASSLNWYERTIGFMPWLAEQRRRAGAKAQPSESIDLMGHQRRTVKIPITALRRGVLDFDRVEIRQTETLGVLRAVKTRNIGDRLIALPPKVPLPKITWRSKRQLRRGGINLASAVGDSQEFIGLRDYRPGDPLRQIHWRSFAKLGTPVVKEHQDEYFEHHALVLDNGIAAGQERLFEAAVSVAASFVDTKIPADSLLDLVLVGEKVWRHSLGRGAGDKSQLLEQLALVQANHDGRDKLTAEHIFEVLQHCGTVVFICCQWDQGVNQLVEKLAQHSISVLPIQVVEKRSSEGRHYQIEATRLSQQLPEIVSQHNHAQR
ncbi:MAG: DUF58 domain-containing protein [Pseudomonadota bacterium]